LPEPLAIEQYLSLQLILSHDENMTHLLSNRTIRNLAGKQIRICASQEQLRSRSSKFNTKPGFRDDTLANESREEVISAKDGYLRESQPCEAVEREFVDCQADGVLAGISYGEKERMKRSGKRGREGGTYRLLDP
jgi:hypothetical protein